MEKCASIDSAKFHHEMEEFSVIREGALQAIDHVRGYLLGVCKAREVRPSQLVPPCDGDMREAIAGLIRAQWVLDREREASVSAGYVRRAR